LITPIEIIAAFIAGVLALFGLGAAETRRQTTTCKEREAAVTIDEARDNIGNKVVYLPSRAWRLTPEEGVITSANEIYAHVRYGADVHAKATRPEDLELLKR